MAHAGTAVIFVDSRLERTAWYNNHLGFLPLDSSIYEIILAALYLAANKSACQWLLISSALVLC